MKTRAPYISILKAGTYTYIYNVALTQATGGGGAHRGSRVAAVVWRPFEQGGGRVRERVRGSVPARTLTLARQGRALAAAGGRHTRAVPPLYFSVREQSIKFLMAVYYMWLAFQDFSFKFCVTMRNMYGFRGKDSNRIGNCDLSGKSARLYWLSIWNVLYT